VSKFVSLEDAEKYIKANTVVKTAVTETIFGV